MSHDQELGGFVALGGCLKESVALKEVNCCCHSPEDILFTIYISIM